MKTIAIASLSGGQGKTTSAYFLARLLALRHKVLCVDLDAQSNLTFFLDQEVELNSPTALEMLINTVDPIDAVFPTKIENLYLIPSDDGLAKAQDYLSSSGMGAMVLRTRLQKIAEHFEYCIIDSPPARSQMSMTVLGAADKMLIPSEASTKGVNSLMRTIELVDDLKQLTTLPGEILGVVPFRARWFGNFQSKQSAAAIEAMKQIATEANAEVFPSIVESERYKQALEVGKTLSEIGYPSLELPFTTILERLK